MDTERSKKDSTEENTKTGMHTHIIRLNGLMKIILK